MPTAVKICGITRPEDALAAAQCGAHAIGLVFYRPTPRFVTAVGLFVDAPVGEVREVLSIAPVNLLQFHGAETPEFCGSFGLPYLKAVRVRAGVDLLQYASDY